MVIIEHHLAVVTGVAVVHVKIRSHLLQRVHSSHTTRRDMVFQALWIHSAWTQSPRALMTNAYGAAVVMYTKASRCSTNKHRAGNYVCCIVLLWLFVCTTACAHGCRMEENKHTRPSHHLHLHIHLQCHMCNNGTAAGEKLEAGIDQQITFLTQLLEADHQA